MAVNAGIPDRRITLKITFAAGQTVDYNFTNGSQTYLGLPIKQGFNELFIDNLTAGDIFYCIEPDPSNTIVVGAAATQGVYHIPRSTSFSEITVQISRLRIHAVNAGEVYLILHNNPRTFIT